MSIRCDFVSNSSSSSFIVIKNTNYIKFDGDNQKCTVPSIDNGGEYQFGWNFRNYYDFWSKLNFCAIQLIELKKEKSYITSRVINKYVDEWERKYIKEQKRLAGKLNSYIKLLKKVCRKKFNLRIELNENLGLGDGQFDAYIDHQSSVTECANMNMFDSYESLYNFLGSTDSYIRTGNDNEEDPEYQ